MNSTIKEGDRVQIKSNFKLIKDKEYLRKLIFKKRVLLIRPNKYHAILDEAHIYTEKGTKLIPIFWLEKIEGENA